METVHVFTETFSHLCYIKGMCAIIYAQNYYKMYVGKYIFKRCFLNENTKSVYITPDRSYAVEKKR